MADSITSTKLLIVEGKDELKFFTAMLKNMELNGMQILSIGGKTNFRETLKALVIQENFSNVTSIGIVRDADNNATAAFQSVVEAVKNVKLQAPDKPLKPSNSTPKIIIMIMPAFNEPGALEDLCLKAIKDNPLMKCVDQYMKCIVDKVTSAPKEISKAKVQVFLASQLESSNRRDLGLAASAGYWPLDDEAFNQVKEFLRQI